MKLAKVKYINAILINAILISFCVWLMFYNEADEIVGRILGVSFIALIIIYNLSFLFMMLFLYKLKDASRTEEIIGILISSWPIVFMLIPIFA